MKYQERWRRRQRRRPLLDVHCTYIDFIFFASFVYLSCERFIETCLVLWFSLSLSLFVLLFCLFLVLRRFSYSLVYLNIRLRRKKFFGCNCVYMGTECFVLNSFFSFSSFSFLIFCWYVFKRHRSFHPPKKMLTMMRRQIHLHPVLHQMIHRHANGNILIQMRLLQRH